MSEEVQKLLQELCRMMVDERKLLQEHIALTRPATTDSDLFLVGLRSALEAMTRRLSTVVETVERLTQHTEQMEHRLEVNERLIAPLHRVAFEILGKCPNCKKANDDNPPQNPTLH
jgi:gamma-glutamylcysteine synthetase